MRKLAMVMALLALAGCGEGSKTDAPKAAAPAVVTQPQVAQTQWDIQLDGPKLLAISDMAAWLLEHGFNARITKVGDENHVIIGPFDDRAVAEAKMAQLIAKKPEYNPQIVEHQ